MKPWIERTNERIRGKKEGRADGRKERWMKISGFSFQNGFVMTRATVFLGNLWLWADLCSGRSDQSSRQVPALSTLLLPPGRIWLLLMGPVLGASGRPFPLFALSIHLLYVPSVVLL